MASFPQFLVGIVGGLIPTFVWQLLVGPARERFNIAKVLRTETQINIGRVLTLQEWRRRRTKVVIYDFSTTKVVFTAIAGRVAELPPETLGYLIRFYQRLNYLEDGVRRYLDFSAEADKAIGGTGFDRLHARAIDALGHIDDTAAGAIDIGAKLVLDLDNILNDYWSGVPPKLSSIEELRRQVRKHADELARRQSARIRAGLEASATLETE